MLGIKIILIQSVINSIQKKMKDYILSIYLDNDKQNWTNQCD